MKNKLNHDSDDLSDEESLVSEDYLLQRAIHESNKTKINFIEEIKGLGGEFKNNINDYTIIKRPWHYKLCLFFKKLLSKL